MSNTTGFTEQLEILTGLGVAEPLGVTKKGLKRLEKKKPHHYRTLQTLLHELACTVSNRTPLHQLFLWYPSEKKLESVFQQPNALVSVHYIDSKLMTAVAADAAFELTGKPNHDLYQMINNKRWPLEQEPVKAEPVPRAYQLILVDAQVQQALYFDVDAGEAMKKAMAPFINFSRRCRNKTTAQLVEENLTLLTDRRKQLFELFSKSSVRAAMRIAGEADKKLKSKKHQKKTIKVAHPKLGEIKRSVKSPRYPVAVSSPVVVQAIPVHHTLVVENDDESTEEMELVTTPAPPGSFVIEFASVAVAAASTSDEPTQFCFPLAPPEPMPVEKDQSMEELSRKVTASIKESAMRAAIDEELARLDRMDEIDLSLLNIFPTEELVPLPCLTELDGAVQSLSFSTEAF